jgi:hypothetical protein
MTIGCWAVDNDTTCVRGVGKGVCAAAIITGAEDPAGAGIFDDAVTDNLRLEGCAEEFDNPDIDDPASVEDPVEDVSIDGADEIDEAAFAAFSASLSMTTHILMIESGMGISDVVIRTNSDRIAGWTEDGCNPLVANNVTSDSGTEDAGFVVEVGWGIFVVE